MSRTDDVSNTDDVFDIRDVIEEFEELDARTDENSTDALDEDDMARFALLKDFLEAVRGNGGDEQWRGSWYPVTFVRDSYFEDFARDEAEQLDLVKPDVSWPYTCIDWEQAAKELQMDYSSTEFDGTTYWYR